MTNAGKRELFNELLAEHSKVFADAPGGPVQVHSLPWNSEEASITPVNRFSGELLGNPRKINISELDNFRIVADQRVLKERLQELEHRYRAIDD
jgi:hypothetical protein